MFDVTEKELKMTFAKNLRNLLDKRGMDRCDLLEYFPKEKKNGEVYHYTKEDIKRLKSKGNSVEKNNELGKIKRWTNGSSMPDYIELMKLCEVLECDADYLLKEHAPISKDISAISEYMGLAPYTIEKISAYRDELKELIDNLVDADWTYKWFRHCDTLRYDCIHMLLSEICSTLAEYKYGEQLYRLQTINGEPKYFPATSVSSGQVVRYICIDDFTKILDGLILEAEEDRIRRGEQ